MTSEQPRFDPRRSEQIRDVLSSTVRASIKPRPARLSRRTFAMVAAGALVAAAALGVVVDRAFVSPAAPETARSLPMQTPSLSLDAESAPGARDIPTLGQSDSGQFQSLDALVAIVWIDGHTGYARQADIDKATDQNGDGAEIVIPVFDQTGTEILGEYTISRADSDR